MKPSAPITPRLTDVDAERVRREFDRVIRELQNLPSSSLLVISGVSLADTIATVIGHGLGRAPLWVGPSAPRGPSSTGRIEEIIDGTHDRSQVVVLKATGWGATITVDVALL